MRVMNFETENEKNTDLWDLDCNCTRCRRGLSTGERRKNDRYRTGTAAALSARVAFSDRVVDSVYADGNFRCTGLYVQLFGTQ